MIDEVVEKWTKKGYGISFRITCSETSADQKYATPEWVKDAGAKGAIYKVPWGDEVWEPDYGDPIFLKKLNNFHKAFAARYDDKPYVRYVDGTWIGENGVSKGADWAEGAIGLMHATYIGYHGHADEFLRENPLFAANMANRAGYWHFLNWAEMPDSVAAGEKFTIRLNIRNRCVAPASHRYAAYASIGGYTAQKVYRNATFPLTTIDKSSLVARTGHDGDFYLDGARTFGQGIRRFVLFAL